MHPLGRQPDHHHRDGKPSKSRKKQELDDRNREAALEKGLEDSFPASDPVSVLQPNGLDDT